MLPLLREPTFSEKWLPPLTSIIGFLELLKDTTVLDDHQQELVDSATTSAKNLSFLVNDILDFTRLDSGNFMLDPKQVNIYICLESVIDIVHLKAEQAGLVLVLLVERKVPAMVVVDSGRLSQVLLNLLGNSVKFTSSGTVLLQVLCCGDGLRFDVQDTGIGFSVDQAAQLFEPFQQADKSITRKYGGTGLGLAICTRVVTLMGGMLEASSAGIGKGSLFHFTIPLSHSHELTVTPNEGPSNSAGESVVSSTISAVPYSFPVPDVSMTTYLKLTELHVAVIDNHPERLCSTVELVGAFGCHVLPFDSANAFMIESPAVSIVLYLPESNQNEQLSHVLHSIRQVMKNHIEDDTEKITVLCQMGDTELIQPHLQMKDDLLVLPLKSRQLLRCLTSNEPISPIMALRNSRPNDGNIQRSDVYILLADDVLLNRRLVCAKLNQLGYPNVDDTKNGRECVEKLLSFPPDHYHLILMDVAMPVMDGREATRMIRESLTHSKVPIVGLTAHVQGAEHQECLDSGMDLVLTKPIETTELQNAIFRYVSTH
eukprot:NODE_90_length_2592_cov_121.130161_g84_i0.p1 GENE.NODE_90_length_2592_cov_121.130161_g84_i0~~NODE_90_length_2592_cov_121.130161_g84_i0.p1  ORF type:complete len:542 (-),score=144.67 NODE_90_length_2592_cov_121.130161_g84_i0:293-1918(-)